MLTRKEPNRKTQVEKDSTTDIVYRSGRTEIASILIRNYLYQTADHY